MHGSVGNANQQIIRIGCIIVSDYRFSAAFYRVLLTDYSSRTVVGICEIDYTVLIAPPLDLPLFVILIRQNFSVFISNGNKIAVNVSQSAGSARIVRYRCDLSIAVFLFPYPID